MRYLLKIRITQSNALDGIRKFYRDFPSYILTLSFPARPWSECIVVGPAFIFEDIVIELIKRIFIESISPIVCWTVLVIILSAFVLVNQGLIGSA